MSDAAQTMKAASLKEPGKLPIFETVDFPIPEIGPTDLLVRLSASGVCGSDYALATGHLGPTHAILGHEGVGRIAKVGASVPDSAFSVGQRVGVAWIRDVCRDCSTCLHENGETYCPNQKQSGRQMSGTFAEYTVVPSSYVVNLPEDVSDELVAPILCGGVTAFKALKNSGAEAGKWVAISGAGGAVGALAVSYAKAMGFRVVGIDLGGQKGEYCKKLGAEAYVDVSATQDVVATVKDITGGGANAVLVTTPAKAAYESALGMLARLGTMVCVGIPGPEGTFTVHPINFIDKGVRLVGSAVGTRRDILDAVEFVRRKAVTPNVEWAKLDDLTDISAKFANGTAVVKYVIRL